MKPSVLSTLIALAAAGTFAIFVACTQVQDTDRRQFNAFGGTKLNQQGLSQFNQMKQTKRISQNPAYNDALRRVGSRLSRVMPVPNAQWEFVVFEDNSPNAFALPGGKVGVHTGLFQITQNDAGLAAVVGHEIAHVVANHAGERMTTGAVAAVGTAILTQVLTGDDASDRQKIATAGALGAAGTGTVLAFSRRQELEADQLGALYMARAGYDPRESVELWKRFAAFKAKQGGNKTPVFLSTHPLDENRIAGLEQYMPRALAEYRP